MVAIFCVAVSEGGIRLPGRERGTGWAENTRKEEEEEKRIGGCR